MQVYHTFRATLVALTLLIFASGCDVFSSDGEDESGIVTLSGQVLNEDTNNPLGGAFITVEPFDILFETTEEGTYTFEVEIDSTMELQITASADGFLSESLPILALADREIAVPPFSLIPIIDEKATSGLASNIILTSQSLPSISVREAGAAEQVEFTFQIADSLGQPVILENAIDVNFSFGVRPNGGEFVSPSLATTDNNGVATVVLSSGTRSGVVQLIAEATVEGRTIRSHPVGVTIHGGMPDQTHFSLGPALRNFPGLNSMGITNSISVIVGDKYSNPARSGSAVYFETTHGVIEGSTLSDDQGLGGVNLISANPLPADGIAHITARTADDQQNVVSDVTPVIFSGTPVITVTPTSAAVNQVYSYTVADYNGNPLVSGTSITVGVTGTAIAVGGNTSVQLDDSAFSGGMNYEHVVRGPGITEFTFVVAEDIDPLNPEIPVVDAISIATSGPNGRLEIVLSGGSEPFSPTDGVSVKRLVDGRFQFSLEDTELFSN